MNSLRVTTNWKWRLAAGTLFQMSWTVGRLFCNFVVFVSESWVSVILVLTVILLLVYFIFEDNIWDPNFMKNTLEQQGTYLKVVNSNTSCLDAHAGFFRLLMKWTFDPYVL